MNKKPQTQLRASAATPLRLGFVPLTDAAPLLMAQELGLFSKYGVRVMLQRELGWATVRDKIIYRELDAAHALAAMPLAASLGLGSPRCDCITGLIINLHGNALTLSNALWDAGVRDGQTLLGVIRELRPDRLLTLGAVAPFSSHHFLLRNWLMAAGIAPQRDVRIVMVPPPQMVPNLKAGHLDGFCVGEPWNSVAVKARTGWCSALSCELAPGHPEKVLMVRNDFAETRSEEHTALLAALLEACEFCGEPGNHEQVVATLARSRFIGVDRSVLLPAFNGAFDFGKGVRRTVRGFTIFHGDDANEPTVGKAAWVLQQMRQLVAGNQHSELNAALARRVFRADIYEQALKLRNASPCRRNHPEPILVH